jgi:F0F1-type ATP synthase membrane subunit b/b'
MVESGELEMLNIPKYNSYIRERIKSIRTGGEHMAKKKEEKKPEEEHVAGVGEKEQREYEHIKEQAEESGRYGERAKEVAARTVLKHHKEKGHKKGE